MEGSRIFLKFIVSPLDIGALQSENVGGETYLGVCIRKAMGSILGLYILRSN